MKWMLCFKSFGGDRNKARGNVWPSRLGKSYVSRKMWEGLGFRTFKEMNLAFLAKLAWKIASGEDNL